MASFLGILECDREHFTLRAKLDRMEELERFWSVTDELGWPFELAVLPSDRLSRSLPEHYEEERFPAEGFESLRQRVHSAFE